MFYTSHQELLYSAPRLKKPCHVLLSKGQTMPSPLSIEGGGRSQQIPTIDAQWSSQYERGNATLRLVSTVSYKADTRAQAECLQADLLTDLARCPVGTLVWRQAWGLDPISGQHIWQRVSRWRCAITATPMALTSDGASDELGAWPGIKYDMTLTEFPPHIDGLNWLTNSAASSHGHEYKYESTAGQLEMLQVHFNNFELKDRSLVLDGNMFNSPRWCLLEIGDLGVWSFRNYGISGLGCDLSYDALALIDQDGQVLAMSAPRVDGYMLDVYTAGKEGTVGERSWGGYCGRYDFSSTQHTLERGRTYQLRPCKSATGELSPWLGGIYINEDGASSGVRLVDGENTYKHHCTIRGARIL